MKIKKNLISCLSALILMYSTTSVYAVVMGDANGDGTVNVRDAAFIASCLAQGKYLSSYSDYNGDGAVNVRDAAAIAKELAVNLPVAETMEEEMLRYVNELRAKTGAEPLTLNSTMNKMAVARAEETASVFSHTRPDGTSCFTIFDEFGVSYRWCGENIAYGYFDAASTFNQWLNSEGHYRNMISENYTEMGIGKYGNYWVQLFRS